MASGLERLQIRRRSSIPSRKAQAATTRAFEPNVTVEASPRPAVVFDCDFQYQAHPNRLKEDITRPVPVKVAAVSLSRPISTNSIFQHRALDRLQKSAARLVQICPNLCPAGRIQCRTRNTTSDIHLNFVPYTWGSCDDLQDIELNEQSFQIRRNQSDFLCYARGRFGAAEWFIHALCIDQRNVSERSPQVQHMVDIYRYIAASGPLNMQCRHSNIDGSLEMPLKFLSRSVGAVFMTSWHFNDSTTSPCSLLVWLLLPT
jgi:hypothetical protein